MVIRTIVLLIIYFIFSSCGEIRNLVLKSEKGTVVGRAQIIDKIKGDSRQAYYIDWFKTACSNNDVRYEVSIENDTLINLDIEARSYKDFNVFMENVRLKLNQISKNPDYHSSGYMELKNNFTENSSEFILRYNRNIFTNDNFAAFYFESQDYELSDYSNSENKTEVGQVEKNSILYHIIKVPDRNSKDIDVIKVRFGEEPKTDLSDTWYGRNKYEIWMFGFALVGCVASLFTIYHYRRR